MTVIKFWLFLDTALLLEHILLYRGSVYYVLRKIYRKNRLFIVILQHVASAHRAIFFFFVYRTM